jgi:hypothetical protein
MKRSNAEISPIVRGMGMGILPVDLVGVFFPRRLIIF